MVNAGKVPTTGDGGTSTSDLNFIKLRSEIITVTENSNAGIVYKLNDQPIQASIMLREEGTISHSTVTGAAVTAYSDFGYSFLNYDPDLLEHGLATVPMSLDQNSTYIFGMNNLLFAEFFAAQGQVIPDGFTLPTGEVVVTLYPASKLSSTNIDYDLFNLIIDPAKYTTADLKYFAERGVSPAIKNTDGSYTLKSQVSIPMG